MVGIGTYKPDSVYISFTHLASEASRMGDFGELPINRSIANEVYEGTRLQLRSCFSHRQNHWKGISKRI